MVACAVYQVAEFRNSILSMPVIVLSCCASKKAESDFIWKGKVVSFLANPDQTDPRQAHPDHIVPNEKRTYREYVDIYNQMPQGAHGFQLLEASALYKPEVYQKLAKDFDHFYIFSAGWGIVRKNFRLPVYDITFSQRASADNQRKWERGWNWNNDKESRISDFNHIKEDVSAGIIPADEEIHFAGGHDYQVPFLNLISAVPNKVNLWFKGNKIPVIDPVFEKRISACEFNTRRRTNWHYEWSEKLLSGKLLLR